MRYRFTESALQSLKRFDQSVTTAIQRFIDEAADQGFYNHSSYSYVFDEHGEPWDKLDLKDGDLNHRVFFTKSGSTFYILEIFDRDEIEYERDLYSLLKRLEREMK